MTTAALLLALALTGADGLADATVNGLKLKAPADWKQQDAEGGKRWDAPSEDASFELSVYPVDPKRDAKKCLDQLLEALGKDGWEKATLGKAPAAMKASSDRGEPVPPKEGEKPSEPVEVKTLTWVGCNGRTKWVMTMTMAAAQAETFEPVGKKIAASIAYPK